MTFKDMLRSPWTFAEALDEAKHLYPADVEAAWKQLDIAERLLLPSAIVTTAYWLIGALIALIVGALTLHFVVHLV